MKVYVFALVFSMDYGFLDLIGNVGVVMLMTTYLLLQLNRLASTDLLYSLLNAVGASLIVVSMFAKFNLSAFVIEVFWVLISLVGIYRYFKLTRNPAGLTNGGN